MERYSVTWEIDVDASSPIEAAKQCLGLLQDRECSTGWVWRVSDRREGRNSWLIDLDDVEEENMSDLVKILSVDHHRNGSGGLGFSIVRFTNLEGMYGPFMAFITDTQRYHPDQVDGIECFVLDTSRLPDVCFVDNGWRGDVIFSELLKSGLWSTDRFKFVKKDSAEELAWDLELGLWVPWKRATGFTAAQCKVLGKVNSDGEWQYYEDSGDDGDE